MCGIVAEHGASDDSGAKGLRMLHRLAHRGPDDSGSIALDVGWLGHRRLSIVDVDGGGQPLANPAGDLFLVGNGEIYNHAEVRAELGESGFATRSDNEVALRLIDLRGPEALGALSGMFAFVAAGADGRFVAARDPVGIKPLYWARDRSGVRFASEMGAFDRDQLPDVEVFPPGCYWTPQTGLVRFERAVPEATPAGPAGVAEPPQEVLDATRTVIVRAVESQMMGDVPVGVFLSGGLDSSLVAAIAARHLARNGRRLQTFAVGLAGSPDLAAARAAARYLDTDHRERVYTAEEAVAALPDAVRTIESFDPSLVRSAVPNLLLSRFTAQHVKVVLTGEGADELFAGYDYLRAFTDPEGLHEELVRTVEGLHNLNLQRCDRVTMAHGLEARVPFLDRQVIGFALSLPGAWKLPGPDGNEKRLLRRAFAGWLPDELLWRVKAEFGDGSGAASALSDTVSAGITPQQLASERHAIDPPIRTAEELAYFRIFQEHLGGVRPEATIGRFATA